MEIHLAGYAADAHARRRNISPARCCRIRDHCHRGAGAAGLHPRLASSPGARTAWHSHPLGPDALRDLRRRPGAGQGRTGPGNPARRRRLDSAGREALAWRVADQRHDPHRHAGSARRQLCRPGWSRSPTRNIPPRSASTVCAVQVPEHRAARQVPEPDVPEEATGTDRALQAAAQCHADDAGLGDAARCRHRRAVRGDPTVVDPERDRARRCCRLHSMTRSARSSRRRRSMAAADVAVNSAASRTRRVVEIDLRKYPMTGPCVLIGARSHIASGSTVMTITWASRKAPAWEARAFQEGHRSGQPLS